MSAAEKSLKPSITKIGIIAGGGDVPAKIAADCAGQGIEVFVVGFEGQTDDAVLQSYPSFTAKLGQTSKVIKRLRDEGIQDLVLIGSIKRPSFFDMIPDFKTFSFMMRVGLSKLGDSDALNALRKMLEGEGFHLHGAHQFSPDLLAPSGMIGSHEPSEKDHADIRRAVQESLALGRADIGQAVIVNGDEVFKEDKNGTDALIKRYRGQGGVLVKLCKPQQDEDLDLPTIGPVTIENATKVGLAGIVIHAGKSLVMDRAKVAALADAHHIFVIGVEPDEEA